MKIFLKDEIKIGDQANSEKNKWSKGFFLPSIDSKVSLLISEAKTAWNGDKRAMSVGI